MIFEKSHTIHVIRSSLVKKSRLKNNCRKTRFGKCPFTVHESWTMTPKCRTFCFFILLQSKNGTFWVNVPKVPTFQTFFQKKVGHFGSRTVPKKLFLPTKLTWKSLFIVNVFCKTQFFPVIFCRKTGAPQLTGCPVSSGEHNICCPARFPCLTGHLRLLLRRHFKVYNPKTRVHKIVQF